MPQSFKYPTSTLFLSDYIIGTDSSNSQENVTRNFKVSEIVSTMLHAINIGTVTSISTASSAYITATTLPNPIIATGSITLGLNATGLSADLNTRKLQYLRGDNTWALPGPTPTDVQALAGGISLTTDTTSINFTGNVSATGGTSGFITVNFPGATALIDSIIAGAGITFTNNIGAVTINNAGVIQTRAGGNVTLSGGTGNVTVNTVANAGTVTSISPGTGIATIANSTSNPELDVEYIGSNNYIAGNLDTTVVGENDIVNYHQITSSNVKSVKLRDIPANILTALTTYIDDADLNKIKNVEPAGFDETAVAKYMVTCTISEYNAIANKDVNTLYFIVGAGVSYTQTLVLGTVTISGSSNYSITTLANGVSGTTVTGPAGTAFSFQVSISGTNGATISNTSGFGTFSGTIAVGGGTTNTGPLSATVTNAASNSVRAKLNSIIYTAGANNLGTAGALGTIWEYAPGGGTGYNVIGDFSPTSGYITSMPYTYSFTPRVRLIDTDTYEWALGEEPSDVQYLKYGYFVNGAAANYSLGWATGQVSSSGVNITQNVTHEIQGFYLLKTSYSASLTVIDNVTAVDASGGSISLPTYSWSISGGAAPNFNTVSDSVAAGSSSIITGLNITNLNNLTGNNQNSFKWNNPSSNQPTITESDYSWTTPATYTWTSSGTNTPATQTISGANGSDTLTIAGQITYAPALFGSVIYKPTYNITYSNAAFANLTTSPTANAFTGQIQVGDTYTISPTTPTVAAVGQYTWTPSSITNTNSVPLTGTMTNATLESQWAITGTLAFTNPTAINPTANSLSLTAQCNTSNITYNIALSYYKQGGAGGTTTIFQTLVAPCASPYNATTSNAVTFTDIRQAASSPNFGYGQVTIVVNRTGPLSPGNYYTNQVGVNGTSVVIKLNGVTQSTNTFAQGQTISGLTNVVTGVNQTSDNITVEINE